jgi:hypothetical protein
MRNEEGRKTGIFGAFVRFLLSCFPHSTPPKNLRSMVFIHDFPFSSHL